MILLSCTILCYSMLYYIVLYIMSHSHGSLISLPSLRGQLPNRRMLPADFSLPLTGLPRMPILRCDSCRYRRRGRLIEFYNFCTFSQELHTLRTPHATWTFPVSSRRDWPGAAGDIIRSGSASESKQHVLA